MADAKKDIEKDAFVRRAYGLAGVDEAQALYREWSGTYDDHMVGELGYVAPDLIARRLAIHLDDRVTPVLDVGCGTGLTSVYLAEQGFANLDGIDITSDMLAKAQARGIYRNLIRADLTLPLDLDDGAYGAAISSGTFTHGHVGPEPLPELVRILRPGGLLACAIHKDVWQTKGFKAAFDRFERGGKLVHVESSPDELFTGQGAAGLYIIYRRI